MLGRALSLLLIVSFGWLAPLLMVLEQAFLLNEEQIVVTDRAYTILFSEEEFNALDKKKISHGRTEISWQGKHWDIFEIHRNLGEVEVLCYLDLTEDLLAQMVNHTGKSKHHHHQLPFFNFFFIEQENNRTQLESIAQESFSEHFSSSVKTYSRNIFQPPKA